MLNNVLEPHQQTRVKVLLGLEEDLNGAGYNVHQSKIAIGSGGLEGKGFMNGTQTKLKYCWLSRRPLPVSYLDFTISLFKRTPADDLWARLWL